MRRTKRRARYTWLPTVGTASPAGPESDDNSSGRSFSLDIPADGSSNVLISTLTFDEPQEGDKLLQSTSPLGTILGNEYFLKRIVGKIFIMHQGGVNSAAGDPSLPAAALVGVGFFVARANDESQGADSPIGSASLSERQENYSPLSEDAIREPWIWRRTWVLGNPLMRANREGLAFSGVAAQETTFEGVFFPPTTAAYGSVADGPHIDAKTARRIKQDERLFFVVATRIWDQSPIPVNNTGLLRGYLDFRLLGALRKARQGSAF